MPITVAHNSKETVSRLIRNEFDKNKQPWQYNTAKDLIQTAKYFGLDELAIEMQNDLK